MVRPARVRRLGGGLLTVLAVLVLVACGGSSSGEDEGAVGEPKSSTLVDAGEAGELEVTELAGGLETVWSLAWDPQGRLWFTERPGRLTRLDGPTQEIEGVSEGDEGGLMGLEFDEGGRIYLMYTAEDENRIVRLGDGGSQSVLVDGIAAARIHDGGRLRFGPDGILYASTGDANREEEGLPQDESSLNGKILAVEPDSGAVSVFSSGRRNVQGLCFDGDGRLLATEHGPDEGDEVNVVEEGDDGGWPQEVGNGIQNYTPTIAPAGCAVYDADLIPEWRGSLLFVTLKDESVRRLTLAGDGSVADEEVLFAGEFGRLRDISVGPDGAVYLATSNRDGRGEPDDDDDRILRIAPKEGS